MHGSFAFFSFAFSASVCVAELVAEGALIGGGSTGNPSTTTTTTTHPLWQNCPAEAQSTVAVRLGGETTSLSFCPWELPEANESWTANISYVPDPQLLYRASIQRMAAALVYGFCRQRRVERVSDVLNLVMIVADLVGPLRALHPKPRSPPPPAVAPTFRFIEPDPTRPYSTRTRMYVVLRRTSPRAAHEEGKDPGKVRILIDQQSLPAVTTKLPETETMFFDPGSLSIGAHIIGVEAQGLISDGVVISVIDPTIRVSALQIDSRFQHSVLVTFTVGHDLIGKHNQGGHALRWPEDWKISILVDGLQLFGMSGNRFAADFLHGHRQGYANVTFSLGGLAAGRHSIGGVIVDQNLKAVAMAPSEVQAEFEFEGGPAESVAILPTESTESSRGSEGDLRPFIRKPGAGVENNRRRVFPPGLSSACALNTSTPACPPAWTFQLRQHEWGFQSQNGEDGVLLAILHHVDPDWRDAKAENMFVEFGVGDGTECNTAFLREAFGWRGVMFDARYASSTIGLHKTVVQPTNINQLFSEHHVPRYFSVLSIDIDFHDYWNWKALDDEQFRPMVVVIEYNSHIPPTEAKTVPYSSKDRWDGVSSYFGASLLALARLAWHRQYTLVHCDNNGVNAFFVANERLFKAAERAHVPTDAELRAIVAAHYRRPNFYNKGWWYPDPEPGAAADAAVSEQSETELLTTADAGSSSFFLPSSSWVAVPPV